MTTACGQKKRTFELTHEEIETFGTNEVRHWTNRVMMRFWEMFRDTPQEYQKWANKLVRQGNTIEGWKRFLKDAVQKLREYLNPTLVIA